VATEHPGMNPYGPESNDPAAAGPAPTESLRDATGSEPEPPARAIGEPTARLERPGAGESGFAEPNPTLAMPGMPDPLAGLGYPAAPVPAEEPDVGGAVYPPEQPRGSISHQEPGRTQPRPPTVAEARARDKARKRAQEAEQAAADALEAKRRKRKKTLIGGAAVVGVAAVVGAGYLACQAAEQPDVTAYCVSDTSGQQTVVNDNDCTAAEAYATNNGYYHSGMPAIFFFNGHQYHYYYYGGANNTIGRPPSGGSFSEPSGAHISTKSGTVVRGGLGSKSGGKSGGS